MSKRDFESCISLMIFFFMDKTAETVSEKKPSVIKNSSMTRPMEFNDVPMMWTWENQNGWEMEATNPHYIFETFEKNFIRLRKKCQFDKG